MAMNVRMLGLPQRPTMPDLGAVGRSLLGVVVAAAAGLHWGSAGAATAAAGAAATGPERVFVMVMVRV